MRFTIYYNILAVAVRQNYGHSTDYKTEYTNKVMNKYEMHRKVWCTENIYEILKYKMYYEHYT